VRPRGAACGDDVLTVGHTKRGTSTALPNGRQIITVGRYTDSIVEEALE